MIDLRTIYLTHFLISLVSLSVCVLLWKQSQKRFEGLGTIALGIAFQVGALSLIFLRGSIPDIISIPFANTLALSGTVMQLIGLRQFTNYKSNFVYLNFLLLAVFLPFSYYFTFTSPSLQMRNKAVALLLFLLCFQIAFLLLFKISGYYKKVTIHVGIAFLLYALLHLSRLVYYEVNENFNNDYFNSGGFEIYVSLVNQLLYVYLTFALVLMVNKRLIADLRLEEEKFSKSFRLAPFAIMLTNSADGKIIDVNEKFFDLSGYSPDEIKDESTLSLGIWHNLSDRDEVLAKLKSGNLIQGEERVFQRKDGKLLNGVLSSVVINVDHKNIILSTIIDVTERKQMVEKLKELNASKDKFFSILAHDLINPFNSILGLSELLTDEEITNSKDEIRKLSQLIHQSSEKALNLVKNLLEWSRSQTGRLVVKPQMFSSSELVQETAQLYAAAMANKEIKLKLELVNDLNIFADKAMINTVLRNLISNAVKFSYRNSEIRIRSEKMDGLALIKVYDTGVGIKQADLAKLFKINSDFSLKGTENEGGTGLGLVLCSEFVRKNNGSISVDSVYGKGSVFSLSLPMESTNRDETPHSEK